MRSYRVPNLRRDLTVSVVLLVMAAAAVVPGAVALVVALAGFAGLMVLRFAVTSGGKTLPKVSATKGRVSVNQLGDSHAECAA